MRQEKNKDNKINARSAARRKFSGTVVGDKMAKTVLVRVDRVKTARKYGKQYIASRKYKVHDERGVCREGDKVVFEETRPLSKEKRWRVIYER